MQGKAGSRSERSFSLRRFRCSHGDVTKAGFQTAGPCGRSPRAPHPRGRGRKRERGSPRPRQRRRRPGCRAARACAEAHLRLDPPPVVVRERVAAPVPQLLQHAAVHRQAVVDLREELVYVRVVGAQQAVADLRELGTREGARGGQAEWRGSAKRPLASRPPFSLTPLPSLPLRNTFGGNTQMARQQLHVQVTYAERSPERCTRLRPWRSRQGAR